jgi:hypothetical protein
MLNIKFGYFEFQSFQLDRKSGKRCYMLAARSLFIAWGDDGRYWKWVSMAAIRKKS